MTAVLDELLDPLTLVDGEIEELLNDISPEPIDPRGVIEGYIAAASS